MDDNNGYGTAPKPCRVMWEMTYHDGHKEIIFEENLALAALLMQGKITLNSHWWKKEWPDIAKETFSINVNCDDVFAWGCSDAQELDYEELQTLWEYHIKDPRWGCEVWCMTKRGYLPQSPVYNDIQQEGIWNLDNMNLKNNPTTEYQLNNQIGELS